MSWATASSHWLSRRRKYGGNYRTTNFCVDPTTRNDILIALCAQTFAYIRERLYAGSRPDPAAGGTGYLTTPNVYTVVEWNVSPGLSRVLGNSGWLGESGKC